MAGPFVPRIWTTDSPPGDRQMVRKNDVGAGEASIFALDTARHRKIYLRDYANDQFDSLLLYFRACFFSFLFHFVFFRFASSSIYKHISFSDSPCIPGRNASRLADCLTVHPPVRALPSPRALRLIESLSDECDRDIDCGTNTMADRRLCRSRSSVVETALARRLELREIRWIIKI